MATQPDSRPSASRRERNAELLTEVLRLHEHKLRRQASRHAQLPDDVDDALQTAYLRFLERFRGVGEPLAWLYTTVKREAWARSRGARLRECSFSVEAGGSDAEFDLVEAMPTSDPGPAERNERRETVDERRAALAALKADERRALWLLGLGFSYEEICKMTGWTHTKVNRCVSEGRAALRRTGKSA
jgi:RNA polymerase sigma factor (sigma-70 family)